MLTGRCVSSRMHLPFGPHLPRQLGPPGALPPPLDQSTFLVAIYVAQQARTGTASRNMPYRIRCSFSAEAEVLSRVEAWRTVRKSPSPGLGNSGLGNFYKQCGCGMTKVGRKVTRNNSSGSEPLFVGSGTVNDKTRFRPTGVSTTERGSTRPWNVSQFRSIHRNGARPPRSGLAAPLF